MFFQSPDATCPKNIKKGFIFSYEGEHDLEVVSVERWGSISWNKWEVNLHCKKCGANIHRFGIDETDMIRAGLKSYLETTDDD